MLKCTAQTLQASQHTSLLTPAFSTPVFLMVLTEMHFGCFLHWVSSKMSSEPMTPTSKAQILLVWILVRTAQSSLYLPFSLPSFSISVTQGSLASISSVSFLPPRRTSPWKSCFRSGIPPPCRYFRTPQGPFDWTCCPTPAGQAVSQGQIGSLRQ